MTAQDRLLTKEEAQAVGAKWNQWDEILACRQDRKTLEALRPIIEWTARGPCLGSFSAPVPYGHCATCQARAVLAEMDKGKEG